MLPQYIFVSIKILLMIIILLDSVFLTPYNSYIYYFYDKFSVFLQKKIYYLFN